jgi:outer membrane protein, heavy metal efflux system
MKPVIILSLFAAVALVFDGCRGIPAPGERQERDDFGSVASKYRPQNQRPVLPALTSQSSLSNFVEYALLNSPTVEAAFYDWSGSVENITVSRSLPDPKLTFQAYIQNALTSLMPGFMQDIPGPGKLKAAARVAAADSQAKYFAFESSVMQAAFDVKSAFYNLYFLDERIRIDRQTLALLVDVEQTARAQDEVGQGRLQDVYRAQIDEDQLTTEVTNLEDSRSPLYAQFKAALGLTHEEADPPLPAKIESTALDLNANDLLDTAFAHNPKLNAMKANVRMAEASIAQARKSNVPDFSTGLQAEIYHPPFYWPQASMTLPIWRDKVAAEIAAAQAGKRAAQARLTAEQIGLAVKFASTAYDYRESTRNLALLENQLVPKARQSLEIARAGYLSSQIDFITLIDAERTWLGFQVQEVQERTRREITLANLSLLIAGVPPPGFPLLAMPPDVSTASHSN